MITFTPGEIARAEEVNANFAEVAAVQTAVLQATNGFDLAYYTLVKIGKIVICSFTTNSRTFTLSPWSSVPIAKLPAGFIPKTNATGTVTERDYYTVATVIGTDGTITMRPAAGRTVHEQLFSSCFVYEAA